MLQANPSSSMGRNTSDKASITAAVIAGVALLVTIPHIIYERVVCKRAAAAAAASQQRALPDDFKRGYVDVQSALATLGNFPFKRYPDSMSSKQSARQ